MTDHLADDPDSRPHPNPDRYETCSECGYTYKLIGADCPHPDQEPAPT